MGSVGAGVGKNFHVHEFQNAIVGDSGPGFHGPGVTGAGGNQAFFTIQLDFHRRAIQFCCQKSNHGFQNHVLLVAKPATNVWLDDPHPGPGHVQSLAHNATADMRDLSGADNNNVIGVIHIGVGCVIFQVAVQDDGRAE